MDTEMIWYRPVANWWLNYESPTFGGNFYALSWPGDDATKRYYE